MALTFQQIVDLKSKLINSGIGTFIMKVDSIATVEVDDIFIHLTAFVDSNFELKLNVQVVDEYLRARGPVSITAGGMTSTFGNFIYDTGVIANHQILEALDTYMSEATPAEAFQGILNVVAQIYQYDFLNVFKDNIYGSGVELSEAGPNIPATLPIG